jgi:hypothetical protein
VGGWAGERAGTDYPKFAFLRISGQTLSPDRQRDMSETEHQLHQPLPAKIVRLGGSFRHSSQSQRHQTRRLRLHGKAAKRQSRQGSW